MARHTTGCGYLRQMDTPLWPNRGYPYFQRWLHNDIQNMSFFCTHKLFEKLVKEGSLE